MSYLKRIEEYQYYENLAKSGKLTLENIFQNKKFIVIARQFPETFVFFLINHVKDFISIAIGEKANATLDEITISLQILIAPSKSFAEFLSQQAFIFNHICNVIFSDNAKSIDFSFIINAVRILTFMINRSHGSILDEIEDSSKFLYNVLTMNTHFIFDDLIQEIESQNKEIILKWIIKFDLPNIIESILINPDLTPFHNRTIIFFQYVLTILKGNPTYISKLKTKIIVDSLFKIAFHSFNSNCLKCFLWFLKNSYCENEENNLLSAIAENLNDLFDVFTIFHNNSSFNSIHYYSLLILSHFIQIVHFNQPIIFELASSLLNQFVNQETNSFLHISYVEYFKQISMFDKEFCEFVNSNDLINLIPLLFSKRKEVFASYWGHLYTISEIINVRVKNRLIEAEADWLNFTRSTLVPMRTKIQIPFKFHPTQKSIQEYYNKSEKHLQDIIDIGLNENPIEIGEYYQFEYEEEEEEEESQYFF